MSQPTAELKDRLKQALTVRDMSAIELSEQTGIPKSSISQYMSGYAKPKQDRIYLICKALDISELWLIGYDVEMEDPKNNSPIQLDEAEQLQSKVNEIASRLSLDNLEIAAAQLEILLKSQENGNK